MVDQFSQHHFFKEIVFSALYIKIKSFGTTKETISKVKRQPSEWEKIIANEANDRVNLKNIQATPAAAQFQKNK